MSPNREHAAVLAALPSRPLPSQKWAKLKIFVGFCDFVWVCRRLSVPSDAALALPIPPKVRSHDAAHTSVRSEDVCFFRHAPSLKGWVPSEKSRDCC